MDCNLLSWECKGGELLQAFRPGENLEACAKKKTSAEMEMPEIPQEAR